MAQPRLQVDLSQLAISDGTSHVPGGNRHTRLADQHMLDLLTNEFNSVNSTRAQHWGVEFEFVGALPRGFSEWTHLTNPGRTPINEVFGHPINNRVRSAREFMDHVDEILLANEAQVRGWIQGFAPNNVTNNNRILAGIQARRFVSCNC